MQFRHPTGVRIATLSGHVTLVGAEWRELPDFMHAQALSLGCECDQTRFRADPEAKPKAAPAVDANDDAVIRRALELMLTRKGDPECAGDFTADQTPNAKVVSKLTSLNVRKEDVMRVFRAMQAEASEGQE